MKNQSWVGLAMGVCGLVLLPRVARASTESDDAACAASIPATMDGTFTPSVNAEANTTLSSIGNASSIQTATSADWWSYVPAPMPTNCNQFAYFKCRYAD